MSGAEIPAVAAEAAARAWIGEAAWLDAEDSHRTDYVRKARAALEAEAPHMLAEVWQAGHSAGDGDQSAMWDARNSGKAIKYADVVTPNPYRPTQ